MELHDHSILKTITSYFATPPKRDDCAHLDFFDIKDQVKIEDMNFVKKFSNEISKPIKKNGGENLDYISTQALSEFIKLNFKDIVGIIYPSSRRVGGENLCLYPDRVRFCNEFAGDSLSPECRLLRHEIVTSVEIDNARPSIENMFKGIKALL